MGDNKRWSAADFAALLWVALHLCTSVLAFMHGLYQTDTSWTWVLLTVWLLGQLAWLCGLLDRPEPASARDLLPLFSWEKIPKEDLRLPAAFLS